MTKKKKKENGSRPARPRRVGIFNERESEAASPSMERSFLSFHGKKGFVEWGGGWWGGLGVWGSQVPNPKGVLRKDPGKRKKRNSSPQKGQWPLPTKSGTRVESRAGGEPISTEFKKEDSEKRL